MRLQHCAIAMTTQPCKMNPFAIKITSHPTKPSKLGTPTTCSAMEAMISQPGPIELKTVAAEWKADLSGLLNLKHPKAVEAGLKKRKEPIKIFTHIIRHPTQGMFLVDTGVSRKFVEDPAEVGVGWVLRKVFGIEEMKMEKSTEEVLEDEGQPLKGVFMTHLHLDHVSGLPDIPKSTPLYIGPGETNSALFMNVVAQGTNDRLFKCRPPLQELQIPKDTDGVFEGVLDVFGDQSLFAIHSPGHTTEQIAFVVRTTKGPVLLTGDICHTRWGWEKSVEPGSFLQEREPSRKSLLALKGLSERFAEMEVRLGHQL